MKVCGMDINIWTIGGQTYLDEHTDSKLITIPKLEINNIAGEKIP